MLVDLSHPIAANMPQVPVLPPVEVEQFCTVAAGAATNMKLFKIAGHTGTHVDAPVHVIDGLASIDQLPLERFVGDGVALDVQRGAGEQIGADDLEAAARGLVRSDDIVLLHTGWDRRFAEPAYTADFPALTLDAADWLLAHGVKLVGIDMMSPDLPPARRTTEAGLVVHHRLLGNGVLIAENLTGLAPLVGRRLRVSALPLRFFEGDGAPARVTAEVVD